MINTASDGNKHGARTAESEGLPPQSTSAGNTDRLPVEFRDLKLSTGARFVLWIICGNAAGSGSCWRSQESLAAIVGKSKRQIQRFIQELKDVGLIDVERRGLKLTNRYRPAHQEATPMSHQEATPMSHPYKEMNYNKYSSAAAAAKPPPERPEAQEVAEALQKLGMPRTQAQKFAAQDPDLCLTALPFLAPRMADPQRFSIRNPIGFVCAVLSDPARFGFTRDADGQWCPPDERGAEECTTAAIHADMARRRREAEERDRLLREQGRGPSMREGRPR